MEQIGQINNNCNTKATLQACANNVPYLVIVSDGCCDDQVLKYVNLSTGVIETTMPAGLTIGECAAEVCMKEYKDACANGVPYLVAVTDDCSETSVAGLEFINLITGGKTNVAPEGLQYWSCDAVPTQSCVAFLETESFIATAGQTTFNISQVASGDVRFSRNGATLHDSAAAVSGTTVTYVPSPNNAEPLLDGDRIDISYIYVDCEQLAKNFTDCIGNELTADTALVTCAALNPEHFEIDPTTGEISSKCCDQVPADQITCYQYCSTPATPSGEGTFAHKEDYNATQAYPYFKNLTYVPSPEGDGQYSIRVVSGRNTPAINLPIDGPNYQVLETPLLIFEATGSGMEAGTIGYAQADVIERAGTDKADFLYQVLDASTNEVIATLEPGPENNSWTQRKIPFTVPASGSVKFQILSKRSGSSAGNDPCIDDTKIAYYPGTSVSCVTYQKVVSNGVTTWYDDNGNVVAQPTVDLTLIACPSSGECTCDPVDFLSADANNQLTLGTDGKLYYGTTPAQDFAQTVYVNSTSPSTATIFDLENPPVTNDNALKADPSNIYIGTDGSTWTYNSLTGTYSTYVYPTTVKHGVLAYAPAGQSIANNTVQTITNYSTATNTAGTGWNATTGEFTAQRAGWYDVSMNLFFQAGNWTGGSQEQAIITKNGSYVASNYYFSQVAVTGYYVNNVTTTTKVYLNVGDKVKAQAYQNSGTAKLLAGGIYNTFSIVEIG